MDWDKNDANKQNRRERVMYMPKQYGFTYREGAYF